MRLFALDNTLAYCGARQGFSFTSADSLAIARELDGLGIHYIDAGCPVEPKVRQFFADARAELRLGHARLVASIHTDAIDRALDGDPAIEALLSAGTRTVALSCGCSYDGPDGLADYCARICEIVRHLKRHTREVIFRAEDFFDGYRAGRRCPMRILDAAKSAGADIICLCDSAGNTLPQFPREICAEVRKRFDGILGIGARDDSDLAVANTLEAIEQGFTYFEGSIMPDGPRGRAASLLSVITNLEQKLGHTVVGPENVDKMPAVARMAAEAAGEEALLASVDPLLLRRLTDAGWRAVRDRIQVLEFAGYELRTAEGNLELLVREAAFPEFQPFQPERYEVTSHSTLNGGALSTATVTVRVGDHVRCESQESAGAVNALERCLRQCLFVFYPEISNLEVKDCRARVLGHSGSAGTGARVRVSLEWGESGSHWTTVGVSQDFLHAAWLALVDGFRLWLMRLGESAPARLPVAADSSWAV